MNSFFYRAQEENDYLLAKALQESEREESQRNRANVSNGFLSVNKFHFKTKCTVQFRVQRLCYIYTFRSDDRQIIS